MRPLPAREVRVAPRLPRRSGRAFSTESPSRSPPGRDVAWAPTACSARWAAGAWARSIGPCAPTMRSRSRWRSRSCAGGRGSTDLANRFRGERQILARLDHPNIARLLDGGATDEGAPYLVMEYVVGQPARRLLRGAGPLRRPARIALFRAVCGAVHYATRTSSSTATSSPGTSSSRKDGTPKLLDFGIAKILAEDLDRSARRRPRSRR